MESWRKVWREGVAPLLSRKSLEALRDAVASDTPELLQGHTTEPPGLTPNRHTPVCGACLIAFCGWRGEGLATVDEVEDFFARMCFEIDRRLGAGGECRWFLDWFDATPRDEMRATLLPEIELALAGRAA
jgi:hypothetical protein